MCAVLKKSHTAQDGGAQWKRNALFTKEKTLSTWNYLELFEIEKIIVCAVLKTSHTAQDGGAQWKRNALFTEEKAISN